MAISLKDIEALLGGYSDLKGAAESGAAESLGAPTPSKEESILDQLGSDPTIAAAASQGAAQVVQPPKAEAIEQLLQSAAPKPTGEQFGPSDEELANKPAEKPKTLEEAQQRTAQKRVEATKREPAAEEEGLLSRLGKGALGAVGSVGKALAGVSDIDPSELEGLSPGEKARYIAAKRQDDQARFVNRMGKAAGHFGAATPHAIRKPIDMGEDPADAVEKLMKQFDAAKKAKAKDKDSSVNQRIEISKQRLELAKLKEGRLSIKDERRHSDNQELSNKQLEYVTQLDYANDIIDRVNKLYPKVIDDLGVYASKFAQGRKYLPNVDRDPNFVKMKQLVGVELADYVKAQSGAAVSEPEAQRLKENLPVMEDSPKEFLNKMKVWKEIITSKRKKTLENIKKAQGKEIKALQNSSTEKPSTENPNEEIRKDSKTGRSVVYDKKTKKPLRWVD